MRSKKKEILLLLIAITLLLSYTAVLANDVDISVTGLALAIIEEQESALTVKDYLSGVSNNPDQYQIVIANRAPPYIVKAAKDVSQALNNVLIKTDSQVGTLRTNILFVGDSLTADTFITNFKDKNYIELSRGNIILMGTEEGMGEIVGAVQNFHSSTELSSPNRIDFGIPIAYSVIVIVGILLFLLILEGHRKHAIAHSKELHDHHKLAAIQKYIATYKEEGHTEDELKDWLINYGYDQKLVEQALLKS